MRTVSTLARRPCAARFDGKGNSSRRNRIRRCLRLTTASSGACIRRPASGRMESSRNRARVRRQRGRVTAGEKGINAEDAKDAKGDCGSLEGPCSIGEIRILRLGFPALEKALNPHLPTAADVGHRGFLFIRRGRGLVPRFSRSCPRRSSRLSWLPWKIRRRWRATGSGSPRLHTPRLSCSGACQRGRSRAI